MSYFLRSRKLKCFYCNEWSTRKQQNGPIRSFRCEHCEAENFLDKNGQITDPPAGTVSTPTPTAPRFARPAAIRTPADTHSDSSSIFCSTCLKNQHILRENLAGYQPPIHLSQASQKAAQEDYQRRLEERYPQVCAKCAPRARERIRRAGYFAKTDHIRRVMEKTKAGALGTGKPKGWLWRSWLFWLAGMAWWASMLLQTTWHALSALSAWQKSEQELKTGGQVRDPIAGHDAILPSIPACMNPQVLHNRQYSQPCAEMASQWVPLALKIAVFTFWWHNRFREKYLRGGGRMLGMRDYYGLQAVVFLFRLGTWTSLAESSTFLYWLQGSQRFLALHLFPACFIPFTALLLSRMVKIDTRPLVSFQARDDQILPDVPADIEPTSHLQDAPRAAPRGLHSHRQTPSKFPISSLAQEDPRQPPKSSFLFQSPTPPSSSENTPKTPTLRSTPDRRNPNNDPDAMDWTPSASSSFSQAQQGQTEPSFNLRPRNTHRQQQSKPTGPSPFQGHIPPAPNARMRHPREPPPPRPNPFQERQPHQNHPNPFMRNFNGNRSSFGGSRGGRNHLRDDDASSVASDDSLRDDDIDDENNDGAQHGLAHRRHRRDNVDGDGGRRPRTEMNIAPPKWFLEKDAADTGLESMFDEIFTLKTPAGNERFIFHRELSSNIIPPSMYFRNLSVAIVSSLVASGAWFAYKGGYGTGGAKEQLDTASSRSFGAETTTTPTPEAKRKALVVDQGNLLTGTISGDAPLAKETDDYGRRVLEMMTPEQATQRLRRNEESYWVDRGKGVVRYDMVQLASNDPIEDDHAEKIIEVPSTVQAGEKDSSDWMFWGVFDGHSGWTTSAKLRQALIHYVARELNSTYATANTSANPSAPSAPSSFIPSPESIDAAIRRGFVSLDTHIVHDSVSQVLKSQSKPQAATLLAPALSGSCALLSFYDTRSKTLRVACTGDSRAVLGSRSTSHPSKWIAKPLSVDQTGGNPEEAARLRAEHPGEPDVVSRGRVLGGLEPSRAFGDASYKWSADIMERMKKEYFGRSTSDRMRTPPYVTAEPVVSSTGVKPEKGDFVVLATDGLWEMLTNEEVVGLVGQWLERHPETNNRARASSSSDPGMVSQDAPNRPSSWLNLKSWFSNSPPSSASAAQSTLPVLLHPPPTETQQAEEKIAGQKTPIRQRQWGFSPSSSSSSSESPSSERFVVQDKNVATHLIRNALGGANQEMLCALLTLPSPYSRRYRDDLTVQVVFFGDGDGEASGKGDGGVRVNEEGTVKEDVGDIKAKL
ncbi:MAG: hypothetical protein M1831_003389 [Alyxoria varia]|nr:MAG: hypothetical protein M1831_003389 [Alyxoria varia]